MAKFKSIKVEPKITEFNYGKSGTNTLKKVFSSSPLYNGQLSDAILEKNFSILVMDSTLKDLDASGNPKDATNPMFPEYNRDYVGGPDGTLKGNISGAPASPYVPNPTSPGEGNGADPTKKPSPPEGFGQAPNPGGAYGNGGAKTIPADTAKKIAKNKVGDWVLGKSYTE